MKHSFSIRGKTHIVFLIVAFFTISSTAFSAGFQISEQSGTGLGRAFAGFGIIGDDLSMAFYNPAGLTMQEGTQIQITGFAIDGSSRFSNSGSSNSTFVLPAGPTIPGMPPITGGNEDGGTFAVIPNLYFVMDLTPKLKYGFAVSAPYGLKTDYSRDWIGRYQAKESELTTVNINPSLAYKVTDSFSVGVGASAEYAEATLSQAVVTGGPDGFAEAEADDWGYGWNVGVMYHPSPTFRAAVGYRSKIGHEAKGDFSVSGLQGPLAAGNGRSSASARVTLPETVHAGIYKELASKWGLSLGFRWTRWNRFDELRIKSVGRADSVTVNEWDNVISANIGVDYFYSDQWAFRGGYMFDESPTNDQFRTARIPDEDRNWFALGASYKANDKLHIDFGYTYILIDDADINRSEIIAGPPTSPTAVVTNNLVGEYDDSDVNIVAVQAVYKF